jgi:hypothetical protein
MYKMLKESSYTKTYKDKRQKIKRIRKRINKWKNIYLDEACCWQALTSTLAIHAQGEIGGWEDKHKSHTNNAKNITIT